MITPFGVAQADRQRALWLSTIAFTICFAVWTIFAIIGVQIKTELGLSETQFGILVATPILTGSLTRLLLGIWTEQYGGRLVFPLQMLLAAAATWMLTWAETYTMYLVAALGVGLAGGSFAIGVAYVSRWFPQERQGTALGIFGAGNVGAAVTKFGAPFVMVAFGWEAVAQVWAIALAAMALIFFVLAKDDPLLEQRRASGAAAPSLAQQLAPLKKLQVWRFSLYYFFVFGAFVALALWLPHYLVERLRPRHPHRRDGGGGVQPGGEPLPCLWRAPVRPVRRAHRDVLDLRFLDGPVVHAVLSADRVRDPRR